MPRKLFDHQTTTDDPRRSSSVHQSTSEIIAEHIAETTSDLDLLPVLYKSGLHGVTDALAVQRTLGNQAVMRILAGQATIQRAGKDKGKEKVKYDAEKEEQEEEEEGSTEYSEEEEESGSAEYSDEGEAEYNEEDEAAVVAEDEEEKQPSRKRKADEFKKYHKTERQARQWDGKTVVFNEGGRTPFKLSKGRGSDKKRQKIAPNITTKETDYKYAKKDLLSKYRVMIPVLFHAKVIEKNRAKEILTYLENSTIPKNISDLERRALALFEGITHVAEEQRSPRRNRPSGFKWGAAKFARACLRYIIAGKGDARTIFVGDSAQYLSAHENGGTADMETGLSGGIGYKTLKQFEGHLSDDSEPEEEEKEKEVEEQEEEEGEAPSTSAPKTRQSARLRKKKPINYKE